MIVEEKTLSTERIYEGHILNLRRDRVITRDGESYREIVEHNGGAAVAAITNEDKIVMVKQYRKAFDSVILEVPAGKIEKGDNPDETVNRELKEETGYTAEKVTYLTEMLPSVGYTQEAVHIYLAEGLASGETDLDANEAIQVVELDFQEALGMVMRGEIKDAKSIIAILMTNQMREENRER